MYLWGGDGESWDPLVYPSGAAQARDAQGGGGRGGGVGRPPGQRFQPVACHGSGCLSNGGAEGQQSRGVIYLAEDNPVSRPPEARFLGSPQYNSFNPSYNCTVRSPRSLHSTVHPPLPRAYS